MKAFLFKAFRTLVVVYIGVLIALYFLQRSFMYFPPSDKPRLSEASLANISEVEIVSSAGDNAIAWWAQPTDNHPVVMFFHGNGSSVYDGRFIYQYLMSQGFGILAVEYPGYPHTSGNASEDSIIAMALAHYDFLKDKKIPAQKIYLYGTSLGAGVAVQLSAQRDVGKMVLEAPFNSMMDMVRLRMPFAAFPFLIKDKYLSDLALRNQGVPILWVHGTKDRVIPLRQGQKLYDGYNGPKEKFIIEGGDHNDLWISGGRDAITEFLKR